MISNTEPLPKKITFEDHRNQTAADCDSIANMITEVATKVRAGDLKAFERFWIEGGTEEGDAKIQEIIERAVLRFLYREERAK